MRLSLLALGLGLTTAACQPTTTRPPFTPLPEAAGSEIRLPVQEATRQLAEALKADSIPTRKVQLRDGYIETPWFDATTGKPTRARRAIGPGFVRVRAWADPARPGSTQLTVETLYRPLVDPSLPARELEREVAPNHPVALRVESVLRKMLERYGGPPPPQQQQPAAPQAEPDAGN